MNPASRRVVFASLPLLAILVATAGLAFSPREAEPVRHVGEARPETSRLTAAHGEVFAFLNDGRASATEGRGLFQTDFFKPPAPPPPKPPAPPAPPPPPRMVAVVYRGLGAFPNGASVAYLSVDGGVSALGSGQAVAEGWRLLEFDGEKAVLEKDGERRSMPFNRAGSIPAAAKP